jgi:hypothetical protein
LDFLLHGGALIAVNAAFYGHLCWLAFWFIKGTGGREQLFMSGWFAHLVLSPLEKIWPKSGQAV